MVIKTLDELFSYEYVLYNDIKTHTSIFENWMVRVLVFYIKQGKFVGIE